MPEIIYSLTTPILQAVRTRLIAREVLSADCIYVVGDENAPKFQATSIIQIWPQDMVDDKPLTRGAGRNAMHTGEPFWVQILTSLLVDEVDRATQSFMDSKLGHYALRNKVNDNLHLFWPTDIRGNALTVEPIHFGSGRKARKPPAPKSGRWTISNILFEIKYRHALNLNDQ